MTTTVTGGASTLSRQPDRRPKGAGNSVNTQGCLVELHGGEKIIDFPMGLHGPIFGYMPTFLSDLSYLNQDQVTNSFPPAIEAEVAELIGTIRPDIEQVRFAKNGGDVCSAAVRLARAVTGRDKIAVYGYHGFGSEFAEHKASTGPSTFLPAQQDRGVPQCMIDLAARFEWGDVEGLQQAARGAACVIVEVPPTDDYDATRRFLEECQAWAQKNSALFILDEVVTGFRFSLGGAAEFYRVTPDLYCYGKAMSNGYACSAIGGRAELMEEFQHGVFFSATFFDDPLGLTAAHATLSQLIERKDEVYPHLWEMGSVLKDGINTLAAQYKVNVKCVGQAPRTVNEWRDDSLRRKFMELCLARGVLFDRPNFVTMSHDRTIIDQSLAVAEEAFKSIKQKA